MAFLIVMLNVFALAAFVAIWLSISFITIDIYKSSKNFESAIALSRITNTIMFLLAAWFLVLGLAILAADNLLPLMLYLILFGSLYFYIFRMYGNILKAVTEIRKDDGSSKQSDIIHNAIIKIDRTKAKSKAVQDFGSFKRFLWLFNVLVCAGTLINFWLRDTGDSPAGEVIFGSLIMILFIQLIFAPIYFIVRRVAFAVISNK
jgi:hypothetical protein